MADTLERPRTDEPTGTEELHKLEVPPAAAPNTLMVEPNQDAGRETDVNYAHERAVAMDKGAADLQAQVERARDEVTKAVELQARADALVANGVGEKGPDLVADSKVHLQTLEEAAGRRREAHGLVHDVQKGRIVPPALQEQATVNGEVTTETLPAAMAVAGSKDLNKAVASEAAGHPEAGDAHRSNVQTEMDAVEHAVVYDGQQPKLPKPVAPRPSLLTSAKSVFKKLGF
jgi:hypothetical protein